MIAKYLPENGQLLLPMVGLIEEYCARPSLRRVSASLRTFIRAFQQGTGAPPPSRGSTKDQDTSRKSVIRGNQFFKQAG